MTLVAEAPVIQQPTLGDPEFWPEPLPPGPLTVHDVLRGADLDSVDPVTLKIAIESTTGTFPTLASTEGLTAADLATHPNTEKAKADSVATLEAARKAQLQSRTEYVIFHSAHPLARKLARLTMRAVEAHNIADVDQTEAQRLQHNLGSQAVLGAQAAHSRAQADKLILQAHRTEAKLNKRIAKQNNLRIVDHDEDAAIALREETEAKARLEKAERTLTALFGGTGDEDANHVLVGELHGIMLDTIDEVTAATEAATVAEHAREAKVNGYSHGELHIVRQRKIEILGARLWTGRERLKRYKPNEGVNKRTTMLEVQHDELYLQQGADAAKLPDYAMYFFGTRSVEQTLPAPNRPIARFTRPKWLRWPKFPKFGRDKTAQEATA